MVLAQIQFLGKETLDKNGFKKKKKKTKKSPHTSVQILSSTDKISITALDFFPLI